MKEDELPVWPPFEVNTFRGMARQRIELRLVRQHAEDKCYPAHDCEKQLRDLLQKLDEDWDIGCREHLLNTNQIQTQMIKLLMTLRMESNMETIALVIRCLVKLTSSFEHLKKIPPEISKKSFPYKTFGAYLTKVRNELCEHKVTWSIIKVLKHCVLKCKEDPSFNRTLKHCLDLVGNLLVMKDDCLGTSTAAVVIANLQNPSKQHGFIWYLLYQNIDVTLLTLIRARGWCKPILRILFLMYQVVDVSQLEVKLYEWARMSNNGSSDPSYPDSTINSGENSGSGDNSGEVSIPGRRSSDSSKGDKKSSPQSYSDCGIMSPSASRHTKDGQPLGEAGKESPGRRAPHAGAPIPGQSGMSGVARKASRDQTGFATLAGPVVHLTPGGRPPGEGQTVVRRVTSVHTVRTALEAKLSVEQRATGAGDEMDLDLEGESDDIQSEPRQSELSSRSSEEMKRFSPLKPPGRITKRKTKKERNSIYKDFGFTSGGLTDLSSSGSDEQEESQPWMVRISDSDHGYSSYFSEAVGHTPTKKSSFLIISEMELMERRRKLLEVKMKGMSKRTRTLGYHLVTEGDILELLRDFTIEFLLKGYYLLMEEVYVNLSTGELNEKENEYFKTLFSWLIYHFLPLATALGMPLNLGCTSMSEETKPPIEIPAVSGQVFHNLRQTSGYLYRIPLSYELFHMLAQEACAVTVSIYIKNLPPMKETQILISGLIRAIRVFMETLKEHEERSDLDQVERYNLKFTMTQIVKTKNMLQLYMFLTRLATERNMMFTKYLGDLISANHFHLTRIQRNMGENQEFNMAEHIAQFTHKSMLTPYGHLLQNFQENPNNVNDCIFTMMHHISGDLKAPQALNIEPIPRTLSLIMKEGVRLCDDWHDLIIYLIKSFKKGAREKTGSISTKSTHSTGSKGSLKSFPRYQPLPREEGRMTARPLSGEAEHKAEKEKPSSDSRGGMDSEASCSPIHFHSRQQNISTKEDFLRPPGNTEAVAAASAGGAIAAAAQDAKTRDAGPPHDTRRSADASEDDIKVPESSGKRKHLSGRNEGEPGEGVKSEGSTTGPGPDDPGCSGTEVSPKKKRKLTREDSDTSVDSKGLFFDRSEDSYDYKLKLFGGKLDYDPYYISTISTSSDDLNSHCRYPRLPRGLIPPKAAESGAKAEDSGANLSKGADSRSVAEQSRRYLMSSMGQEESAGPSSTFFENTGYSIPMYESADQPLTNSDSAPESKRVEVGSNANDECEDECDNRIGEAMQNNTSEEEVLGSHRDDQREQAASSQQHQTCESNRQDEVGQPAGSPVPAGAGPTEKETSQTSPQEQDQPQQETGSKSPQDESPGPGLEKAGESHGLVSALTADDNVAEPTRSSPQSDSQVDEPQGSMDKSDQPHEQPVEGTSSGQQQGVDKLAAMSESSDEGRKSPHQLDVSPVRPVDAQEGMEQYKDEDVSEAGTLEVQDSVSAADTAKGAIGEPSPGEEEEELEETVHPTEDTSDEIADSTSFRSDGQEVDFSDKTSIESQLARMEFLKRTKIREMSEILKNLGFYDSLKWLQQSLLDVWRIKVNSKYLNTKLVPLEPLPFYYLSRDLDIPLFCYSIQVEQFCNTEEFLKLAHLMGIRRENNQFFIPHNLPASDILTVALFLGIAPNTSLYPELTRGDAKSS